MLSTITNRQQSQISISQYMLLSCTNNFTNHFQGTYNIISDLLTENRWAILFSHPRDYTPVCTTELARMVELIDEFKKRQVKVIALSCDSVQDHLGWSKVGSMATFAFLCLELIAILSNHFVSFWMQNFMLHLEIVTK